MAIIILPLLTAARIEAALHTAASFYGTTLKAVTATRRPAGRNPAVEARSAAIKGLREMGYPQKLLADRFDYRVASLINLLGTRMPEDHDAELFLAIKQAVETGKAVHLKGNAAAKPARSGKYIFTPPGCRTIPLPPKRSTAADLMQAHAEQQRRVDHIQRLEASYLSGHYPNASSRTT